MQSLIDRFWSKVQKTDGCWLWLACRSNRYGAFKPAPDQPMCRAHRMAWQLTNGPIPDGLSVCHHCDTPTCVNPAHLFLGTQSDNLRDMAAKQRGRGKVNAPACIVPPPKNFNAKKLSADDVRTIRARHASGERVTALARAFLVSHPAIVRIVQRRTWQSVSAIT
jgi:hypothetical protein